VKNIWTCAAGLAVFLLWQANYTMAGPGDTLLVRGSNVNVRTGPGRDFSVARQVDKGTAVIETKRQGEWIAVKVPSTALSGWIYADLLASSGKKADRPPATSSPPPQEQEKQAAATIGFFPDRKISIKLKKAPIAEFFAAVSKAGGEKIEVSPGITALISMKFKDASMNDALQLVLDLYGLTMEKQNGRYYVKASAKEDAPPDK